MLRWKLAGSKALFPVNQVVPLFVGSKTHQSVSVSTDAENLHEIVVRAVTIDGDVEQIMTLAEADKIFTGGLAISLHDIPTTRTKPAKA